RLLDDQADRCEVDIRLVGEVGIERDRGSVRPHVTHLYGVAVGVGAHRSDRAGGAASTHDVLVDELLTECARHMLANDAGNDIARPPGREWHDRGYGACRIGWPPCDR